MQTSRRMRIAIYWEQADWGGVDSHLHALLASWPCADDEFVLFYNRGNRGFERIRADLARLPAITCVELPSFSHNELLRRRSRWPGYQLWRTCLHFLQPLTFLGMARRLRKVLVRQGPFDVLLADNGGYPAAWGCLSAILAAHRAGIPVRVLLVHHAATFPAPLMGGYEWWVERRLGRVVTAVVCVSRATLATLQSRRRLDEEAVRFRVIPNGVLPEAPSAATPIPAIRVMARAEQRVLLGVTGRIEPYKGHEDILFAIHHLPPDLRQRVKLAVIGRGETSEVQRLERLADQLQLRDQVSFLGYLAGTPGALLAQLDLLISATRSFEGFGLTILEAMQVGTPIIATRVGGVPEFVNETNGVLVTPSDPADLSRALAAFLQDQKTWKNRAEKAQVEFTHTSARMALAFRQLFLECLMATT